MRHSFRNSLGQFAPIPKHPPIVAGRLYGYRGTIVRAHGLTVNGKRHVSFHKQLHGFVGDDELQWIPRDKVNQYLQTA
jgi:hypothetical protein